MEKFNLQAFAGGAVAEQISAAMQRVYENIADPNTYMAALPLCSRQRRPHSRIRRGN